MELQSETIATYLSAYFINQGGCLLHNDVELIHSPRGSMPRVLVRGGLTRVNFGSRRECAYSEDVLSKVTGQ